MSEVHTGDSIPITIVNGFLGAGKTTVILNILKHVSESEAKSTSPNKYRIVWLKNEFGVNEVDSALASQSAISSVKEVLNGCLCCTLVGKLSEAIREIVVNTPCDRIIIETSGSAYPAPLAQEVNRLTHGTDGVEKLPVHLDGVLCVIDAVNFTGYEDTSLTARIQAEYTDMLILNKVELAGETQTELVKDKVLDLNPETPLVYTKEGFIDPSIIFSVDQRTDFSNLVNPSANANDVDVLHVEWIHTLPQEASTTTTESTEGEQDMQTKSGGGDDLYYFTQTKLDSIISFLKRSDVIRAKGVISMYDTNTRMYTPCILNYAFSHYTMVPITDTNNIPISSYMTSMYSTTMFPELQPTSVANTQDITRGSMNTSVGASSTSNDDATGSVFINRLTVMGMNINKTHVPRKLASLIGITYKHTLHTCTDTCTHINTNTNAHANTHACTDKDTCTHAHAESTSGSTSGNNPVYTYLWKDNLDKLKPIQGGVTPVHASYEH